jgi:hypothetical protein
VQNIVVVEENQMHMAVTKEKIINSLRTKPPNIFTITDQSFISSPPLSRRWLVSHKFSSDVGSNGTVNPSGNTAQDTVPCGLIVGNFSTT